MAESGSFEQINNPDKDNQQLNIPVIKNNVAMYHRPGAENQEFIERISFDWTADKQVTVRFNEGQDIDNPEVKESPAGKIMSQADKIRRAFDKNRIPKEVDEILKTWPIFPAPIVASKLYQAYGAPNYSTNILVNNLDVLRCILTAHNEIAKSLDEKTRNEIEGRKNQVLNVVKHRMYAMFMDLSKMKPSFVIQQFIAENFYNTLNLIRIHEFTVLDMLNVPKSKQAEWITPEMFPIPLNPKVIAPIGDSLKKDTLQLIKTRLESQPSKEIQEQLDALLKKFNFELPLDKGWTSNLAIWATLLYAKSYIKSFPWSCSNMKTCKNKETAEVRFKECSKCRWERYCSKECQVAHWKEEHKQVCGIPFDPELMKSHRVVVGPDVEAEKKEEAPKEEKKSSS